MTINDHISHLQSIINKGIASDDRRVEDEHIYHLMKVYRARLLWEKKNKFYKLSPFNYQTIDCLPLELSELNECECYETGCLVLKSKCKLPKVLSFRNNIFLKVTLLDGTVIPMTSPTKSKMGKYRKTKINEKGWFIHNNKLVVITDNRLQVVTVTAIFEDPLELGSMCDCNPNGEETGDMCFNPLEEDFPLDAEMISSLYKLILDDLGVMYKFPQDDENNAKSTEITNDKE